MAKKNEELDTIRTKLKKPGQCFIHRANKSAGCVEKVFGTGDELFAKVRYVSDTQEGKEVVKSAVALIDQLAFSVDCLIENSEFDARRVAVEQLLKRRRDAKLAEKAKEASKNVSPAETLQLPTLHGLTNHIVALQDDAADKDRRIAALELDIKAKDELNQELETRVAATELHLRGLQNRADADALVLKEVQRHLGLKACARVG